MKNFHQNVNSGSLGGRNTVGFYLCALLHFLNFIVLYKINNKNILFSKQKKLEYAPEYSYKQVLPKGANTSDYTTNIVLNKTKLPIKQGDTVGHLEVINDGKLEHSIDLIAQNDVNSIFGFITENKIVIGIFKGLLIIFTVLISIFILLIIRKKIRRNIKRKNRNIYSNKNKKRK